MARPRLQGVKRTPSGQISRSRESIEQRGMLSHDGYVVYFAKCGNRVKIGFSGVTKTRMATLTTSEQGQLVRIVGLAHVPTSAIARKLEAKMHEIFAAKKIKGEWFTLTMSDVLGALDMCRRIGVRTSGGEDAKDDVSILSGLAFAPDY